MNSRDFGRQGEDFAADYLRQLGFDIVGRSVYVGHYELDILAAKDDLFLFVEVKTRRMLPDVRSRYGRPGNSAVRYGKKKNLLAAARIYINQNRDGIMENRHPRFDIIEVYADPASAEFKPLKVVHLKGAINYQRP
jgi:putative endonuclease